MKYKINENYVIDIKGTVPEMKKFIKELSNVLDKGMSYSQIQEEVENLENINDFSQYTFGIHNRLYFNKNMIKYTPNANGEEARRFHFEVFEPFFYKVFDAVNHKK